MFMYPDVFDLPGSVISPGSARDAAHMHEAFVLAQRGVGRTAPDPSVGCVLIQGRLHAIPTLERSR